MYSIVATILAKSSYVQVMEAVTELMSSFEIDILPNLRNLVLVGFK